LLIKGTYIDECRLEMLLCAPSGINLREAKVRNFGTGPLHNNLEKRFE
jgi:hypothetical protein